jgi:hypothetical protein
VSSARSAYLEPARRRVESRETPWDGVLREETGLVVAIERLAGIYSKPDQAELVFSFVCTIRDGIPTITDEADEIAYLPLDEIPRNTLIKQVERIHDALGADSGPHLKVQPGRSSRDRAEHGTATRRNPDQVIDNLPRAVFPGPRRHHHRRQQLRGRRLANGGCRTYRRRRRPEATRCGFRGTRLVLVRRGAASRRGDRISAALAPGLPQKRYGVWAWGTRNWPARLRTATGTYVNRASSSCRRDRGDRALAGARHTACALDQWQLRRSTRQDRAISPRPPFRLHLHRGGVRLRQAGRARLPPCTAGDDIPAE